MFKLIESACYEAVLTFWSALNSNLGTALFAAVIGGFIGVYFAYVVIEHFDEKKAKIKRISAINATISICLYIANVLTPLRREHTAPMLASYLDSKAALEAFAAARARGEIQTSEIPKFSMNLFSLTAPSISADKLEDILLDKVAIYSRALSLCSALSQNLRGVFELIEHRNQFIQDFRSRSLTNEQQVTLYFGLPNQQAETDLTNEHLLYNLDRSVGEALWYAKTLSDDLTKAGKQLAADLGDAAPNIADADYAPIIEAGLIPPDEGFKTWQTNFKEFPPKKQKRFSLVFPLLALLIFLSLAMFHLLTNPATST